MHIINPAVLCRRVNKWFNSAGITVDAKGLLLTKQQQTTKENIYAGGDMVSGADLVVTAIAQGRDAAKEIIKNFKE